MRLYHFTTQDYGVLAIQKKRLKIARIGELNDPFEFLGWNLRDRGIRSKLKRWKRDHDRKFGILCFSREWSNPLLWGHYANKHKGMALGFDVPENDRYIPVEYCRKRLPMPIDPKLDGADLKKLLLTKFAAWRYESEYRCFCSLSDSIHEGEFYFEPFSDNLKLAEVIVGDRATITRKELAKELGGQHEDVISFKARPAFRTFSVVENRNSALWK